MSHVSPLTRSNDIGDLMKATGYTLLTVDLETINVHYPDMFTLIEHIHGMGEQHAPVADVGSPSVSRDAFLAANAAYDHLYRDPSNGLCLATVDVVMMVRCGIHSTASLVLFSLYMAAAATTLK
jgi:NADH dehydrogenase [ubiquinone] 1 alpha subcomplex assembly factor 5